MIPPDLVEKQFDILYASLGDLQTGFISGTSQVAGFLLLAIGWLATSSAPGKLLRSHPRARQLIATALISAYGLYVFAACMVYIRSRNTFRLLAQINLMPPAFYQSRLLSLAELLIFIGGTFFLLVLTFYLLLKAVDVNPAPQNSDSD